MLRRTTITAILALATVGCREGVQPFTPAERVNEGPAYALTFGSGVDADPRWSASGDSVLYHTTLFNTLPQVSGVVLAMSFRGGTARPVFPEVQNAARRPFVTPAYSADGERVAYMDLMSVDPPASCSRVDEGVGEVPLCVDMQPRLDSAIMRIRRVGEQGGYLQDPSLPVKFPGTDPAFRTGSGAPRFEQLLPFQDRYVVERALLFRPTWDPAGDRVAFSDGVSIRIWNIGDATSAVVPGTEDGVSAAWSPDGQWIAFTALVRTDSVVYVCSCASGTSSVPAYRTVYTTEPGMLVIIRPDGSERTELGTGEDPAWSPDGAWLYVRQDGRIVRIPRSGGAAVPVPNTERGRSPAVSPDGTRLAFSRRKPDPLTLDHDIWVVTLEQ